MKIKISAVEGNRQWLDGGSMFGNAPRALWEKWTEVDDRGRIPLACRCMVIEADDLKILCETGIGAFFEPKLADRFGVQNPERHMLRENLKALGFNQEDFDFVILSHLHFDHAGGLLPTYQEMQAEDWQLLFPKAQYVVGEEAWFRAQNPHSRDRASFVPALNKKLEESGRLCIVSELKPPKALKSFISFYPSMGHTPGQIHTMVKGQNETVVFAGDLIPGVPWVNLPITMGYDRYPEKLIDEKKALFELMNDKQWSVFYTHDPNFSLSRVQQNDKGKYEASEPQVAPVELAL